VILPVFDEVLLKKEIRSTARAFLLGLGLLTIFLLPQTVLAQARAQVFGRVTTLSAEGEPLALPGAIILLVSKADTNRRYATEADSTGTYSLLDITPGLYTLTATLGGYEESTQEIGLDPGEILELPLTLAVGTVREQVTVTAGADTLQTDQTTARTEISGHVFDSAALASERFMNALPLVPGVVRGPDGLMRIKGARSTQSGWLVNSANVTDPVTGDQALSIPVDAIQNLEVLPNPYSAEYGKFAGAVTSIETKKPSGNWRFRLNNFLPRVRRRNGKIRGIESTTPRLTGTGPLYKDKVFLMQSFEYRLSRNPITSLPELEQDTDTESFDSFTQIDVHFSTLHKGTVVMSIYPQKHRFATLDTFNPQPVTANRRQTGWMAGLRDRYIFRNGSLLETTLSVKDFDVTAFPATAGPVFLLRPSFNDGSYFNHQNRISRRYEWLEAYSFAPRNAGGQHWLKVGVNVARDLFRGLYVSTPVEVRRVDGTLSELITFAGGGQVQRDKTELTYFLQDKWNVNNRLTFDLGARYDYDTLADRHNLAPRLGIAYVLTSDNKTVLRGGAGIFYDKVPLNIGVFEQFQQRTVTRFALDGITPLAAPLTFENRLTSLENPRSLGFNLELDREVKPGLLVRVGYLQRETRHDFLTEAFDNFGGVPVIETAARGNNRYREFQITTNYNFNENSFLNISYVRSLSEGDLNNFSRFFGTYQNPLIRPNEFSLLEHDSPHRVVAWGDVELPLKIHLAPTVEVRSGFPFSHLNQEQNFVGPRTRAGRFPVNQTLDLQIYRRFSAKVKGKKRTVLVGLKVFNALSHFNPRDVQQNLDAANALGFFNARGRLYRGKLTVEF
jgi:hypothetical protein